MDQLTRFWDKTFTHETVVFIIRTISAVAKICSKRFNRLKPIFERPNVKNKPRSDHTPTISRLIDLQIRLWKIGILWQLRFMRNLLQPTHRRLSWYKGKGLRLYRHNVFKTSFFNTKVWIIYWMSLRLNINYVT